ncbi:MAG: PAS domain-containing protein, partial [Elusimicrobia bacterium]|nr:PAS domain-containing protein [Elusimicrobiota bacterium]
MTAQFIDALRPLFDCLVDGICVTDDDGRLLYANAAAGELLGPAARQADGARICDLLCRVLEGSRGETSDACPLRTAGGETDAVVFKGPYRPTGKELRVRCLRVRLPSVERRFLLIEDVSTQAETGRLREQWREMLAHDFRSPLSVMFATLRYLEDLEPGRALTPADKGLVAGAVRNGRRLEALIDDFLETARLESGAVKARTEDVDAARLARELVDERRGFSQGRRLELNVTGAPVARADPELLRRVVANLFENALKFAPAGGRITVEAAERDGSVLISVEDDGPGIAPADLPRLFDRFYRGAGGGRGYGLGLAFCRAAA